MMHADNHKAPAKSFWRRCAAILSSQFFYAVLLKTVRGSFFLMGGVMLVSATSAWKFADSSFTAHDFVRSAHWTAGQASEVTTIGIDDTAYAQYFGGQSPLDRGKLWTLLQTIQAAAPGAKKIVIDLDLSPVLQEPQDDLFALFAARKDLWVLAEPMRGAADENEGTKRWRHRLCDAGIAVGLPYLPTEFGYINNKQQFVHSLADVAMHPAPNTCLTISQQMEAAQSRDQVAELARIDFPMSPSYARDGMVVPFHGDLQELADTLKEIGPKYVVVGGVWGTGDILDTPFGNRYGAQLHAAAIDGAFKHQRTLPYVLNFVVMWCAIGLLTIVFARLQDGLHGWLENAPAALPGHQFLAKRLWPLFVTVLSFAWVIGLSELLAMQFAWTGVQINTSVTAATMMAYLLFNWNFGLNAIHHQTDVRSTMSHAFLDPIRADWHSLVSVVRRWRGREPAPQASTGALSPGHAVCEFMLALASLLLQSLIPLATMYFSILKSF